MNELRLVPFAEIEDEWILSDAFLVRMYEQTRDEGLLNIVFVGGGIAAAADFIALCKSPRNAMVFAFEGQICVGYAWLSGMAGNYAFAHFCFFKSIWGRRTSDVGKMLIDYWFSFPGPLFDTIIGVIPGFNRLAHKFVVGLGFVHLGTIPGMLKNRFGRENAEVFYLSRPDHGQEQFGE